MHALSADVPEVNDVTAQVWILFASRLLGLVYAAGRKNKFLFSQLSQGARPFSQVRIFQRPGPKIHRVFPRYAKEVFPRSTYVFPRSERETFSNINLQCCVTPNRGLYGAKLQKTPGLLGMATIKSAKFLVSGGGASSA